MDVLLTSEVLSSYQSKKYSLNSTQRNPKQILPGLSAIFAMAFVALINYFISNNFRSFRNSDSRFGLNKNLRIYFSGLLL